MLEIWADRICQHYWGVSLDCPVLYNGRLKRVLGRFRVTKTRFKDGETQVLITMKNVLLSKVLIKGNPSNPFIVEKILKHELCHWYLFTYNNETGFSDGDDRFESELVRIEAISQQDIKSGGLRINKASKV